MRIVLIITLTCLAVWAKPRLHRCGNNICDPEGSVVQLRGVSVADIYYTDINRTPASQYSDLNSDILGDDIRAAIRLATDGVTQGFHSKVVRLPVHPDNYFHSTSGGWENIPKWIDNPAAWDEIIDRAVQECTEQDAYCILDLHFVHYWNEPLNGVAVPGTMKDVAIAFWERYGPLYKDNPNIIFELVNEPITQNSGVGWSQPDLWESFQDDVMTDLLHTIRVTLNITETVLIVGTPRWATTLNEINNSNDYDLYDPIMYSLHLYPHQIANTNFTQGDFDNTYVGTTDDTRPVFMTEWGYQSYDDRSMTIPSTIPFNYSLDNDLVDVISYRSQLLDWMEAPSRKVSWTAWAFDNAFQSIMWHDPDFSELADEMDGNYGFQGQYIKNRLAAKKDIDQPCDPCDVQAPAVPQNLRVTNTKQAKVYLSWDASIDNSGVAEYLVFKNGIYAFTIPGTQTYAMVRTLQGGAEYTFSVRAKDAVGNKSAHSDEVVAFTTLQLKAANATLKGLGIKNATGSCPAYSSKQTTYSSAGDRAQWSGTYLPAGNYNVTVHWASAASTNRKFQLKFGKWPKYTWNDMPPTGSTASFTSATATINVTTGGNKAVKLITKNGSVSICSVKFDPIY
ncbi:MAG: cellulase family glycosylhydrolase [Fibrobacterales bacterium]